MLKSLIHDEAGFVVSTELILVTVILVIGMIVGQTTLRDQVVTELADTADAVSSLDQSFTFDDIEIVAINASVAGSAFADASDFCDASDSGQQGIDATEGVCVLIDGGDQTAGATGTTFSTAN